MFKSYKKADFVLKAFYANQSLVRIREAEKF